MKLTNLLKIKKYQCSVYVYTLTLLFFSLVTMQSAKGQEASDKGKLYGGLGYFAFGFTQVNIDALNTALQNEGFGAAPKEYISFGGGGHGIIGNVIIGGEGHSFSSNKNVSDRAGTQVESGLEGGYGFLNLGYVALSKKALLLYPMLGIGGGGMRLKLSDAAQATGFQNILQNHQRSVEIDNGGFLLNFQLAADFVLGGNEAGRGGLLLGLHGGYIYSPTKWNWSWQGAGISDGPDVNLSGPYVTLTFGAGGYGRMQLKNK